MNDSIIAEYLKSWDASVSVDYSQPVKELEARREFLKKLALGATAVVFADTVLANAATLNTPSWQSIAAVHLYLFPVSKNQPDAKSINATAYLKSVLEWPGVDQADKKFILDGVGWLDGISNKLFQNSFDLLTNEQKEKALRTVEKSQAGENWLSLMLLYLIEALLTDPVYGGNVNGAGWVWLEHQPGYPLPLKDKRYFNL
ncbi:MAG: gluconate 2-dehydrogenase subunit 3 family protein [Gammaproteobacteria bacterium]|nr:gluconate 2-dehydrogenase subunit 3 family protein [Gammaproteobacteria bacterium]